MHGYAKFNLEFWFRGSIVIAFVIDAATNYDNRLWDASGDRSTLIVDFEDRDSSSCSTSISIQKRVQHFVHYFATKRFEITDYKKKLNISNIRTFRPMTAKENRPSAIDGEIALFIVMRRFWIAKKSEFHDCHERGQTISW